MPDDDLTTNYTKDDRSRLPHYPAKSKEPVYGAPEYGDDPNSISYIQKTPSEAVTPQDLELIAEEEDRLP